VLLRSEGPHVATERKPNCEIGKTRAHVASISVLT